MVFFFSSNLDLFKWETKDLKKWAVTRTTAFFSTIFISGLLLVRFFLKFIFLQLMYLICIHVNVHIHLKKKKINSFQVDHPQSFLFLHSWLANLFFGRSKEIIKNDSKRTRSKSKHTWQRYNVCGTYNEKYR